jgi:hypothetical protein
MVRRCLAYAVAAACASASVLPANAGPRAVIELFTSQGCSSCPPADRLLGELAGDSTFVAITLPVDYWDYLGWKDTLARPQNSARQTAYMKARGDRQRYTPQVVVNGAMHALGSSREAIEKAIAKTRQNPATLSIPVKLALDGRDISLTVSGADGAGSGAEVWIASLTKAVPVAIQRGENKGKTITYFNVVRSWTKLGTWSGRVANWRFPVADIRRDSVDGAAAFLQAGTEHKPGAILGAAITGLK